MSPRFLIAGAGNKLDFSNILLDPACGSAGMFVQTGHFVENRGEDASAKITFYGQEKSDTNTGLARMNLVLLCVKS